MSAARLSRSEAFALRFALWCREHGIDPAEGARLVALARRAFAAGERACNVPGAGEAQGRAVDAFNRHAAALGFGVQWPGLAPCLTRAGRWVELPAI